jgi:hypothetical protein
MSAAASQGTPGDKARPNRAEVAESLVKAHFDVEPELEAVYLMRARDESDPEEPIALLEVNPATFPTGSITPFAFAPTGDVPFPVLIAEVTRAELEAAKRGEIPLPNGWSLEEARVIERRSKR